MKVTFSDKSSMEILGVHGFDTMHEGVQRDSLTFLIDPTSMTLEQAMSSFTAENCKSFQLTDIDGTYVHENYTIRLEAGIGYKDYALTGGRNTGDRTSVIYVSMAQSTLAERTLQNQQEVIDTLLLAALEG